MGHRLEVDNKKSDNDGNSGQSLDILGGIFFQSQARS